MHRMKYLGGTIAAAVLCAALTARAQSVDVVDQLIERIVRNEQTFLTAVQDYRPVMETYLQEMADPSDARAIPSRDHYMVGKVELGRDAVRFTPFFLSEAFRPSGNKKSSRRQGNKKSSWRPGDKKSSRRPRKKKSPRNYLLPEGFVQMLLPDAQGFDRQTYEFEYVRREFLGDVRCLVFDVRPRPDSEPGRFVGRIWVEDQQYHIVRFNGTYTLSEATALFFHFDSWRTNVAPGVWVPSFVYVEDAGEIGPLGQKIRFKGQSRLWGYQAFQNSKLQELTQILVTAEQPVEDETGAKDVTPLESQRSWTRQAEENVIHRLERSGLLAPKSDVDPVLNTVVRNLAATNDISLEIECRVLLTTPLETFSIGQSIVISRGLIDVLPDEASLAMVLADELAHIALGHQTETMYAFSDLTMVSDEELFGGLRLERGKAEMDAAGAKAVEILSKSPYKEKLANARLFLKALAAHAPALPNLIRANLGNQLSAGDHLLRLSELAGETPELDEDKIEQIAALPLGSRVHLDPWTSKLRLIKTKPVALVSARDKMPFEVTPFMIHLTRASSGKPPASSGKNPASSEKGTMQSTQAARRR